MSTPTPTQILMLADEHIRHYSRMLDAALAGDATIVPGEMRMYRVIWQHIRDKGGVGLNAEEMQEVVDACMCGDFDHIVPMDDEDDPFEDPLEEDPH